MQLQHEKQNNTLNVFRDIIIMAERNLLKLKHNPDSLIDVTILPIFFMLIFSYLFGGAISGSVQAYLPIIVPGILIQTLLMASSATGTQLREDFDTGVFDRFKSLPTARIAPLAGLLVSDILRYILSLLFSLGTGFLLGWRPEANFIWIILASIVVIFGTWAISWIFALIGLLSSNASTIASVSTMVTMLMSFLSNAFVPTDTLPEILRKIAELNPVTFLVNSFKDLAYTGTVTTTVVLTLVVSVAIVSIFLPLTIFVYNKKS